MARTTVRWLIYFFNDANRVIALGTVVLALISLFGLRDARHTFEIGSRAWISPIAVGLAAPIESGKPINIGLRYNNVGNLPATDLHAHFILYSFQDREIDDGSAMRTISYSDVCAGVDPWKDAEVVYPRSGGVTMTVSLKPIDSKTAERIPLYDDFMSDNHTLVVQYCIAYRTIGGTHKSAFCYYYRPGVTVGIELNRCDNGNRAD